jgi:outer membrane lipoprotein
MIRALLLLLLLPLLACMRPPKQLAGKFDPITIPEAQATPREGVVVRWGGTLVGTRPERDQTCFEVAAFELDGQARPGAVRREPGPLRRLRAGLLRPRRLPTRP